MTVEQHGRDGLRLIVGISVQVVGIADSTVMANAENVVHPRSRQRFVDAGRRPGHVRIHLSKREA